MIVTETRQMTREAFDQLPQSSRNVAHEHGLLIFLSNGATLAFSANEDPTMLAKQFVEMCDLFYAIEKLVPITFE